MDSEQFGLEVRQHNALTNARYEYSEAQANLFLVLLSKLRKDGLDDVYQITVSEMEKRTGNKYNYKQLRESTKEMIGRAHEIETFHKGKPVLRQLVLFNRIDYILGTGVIELEINKYATQYLFDLKNNFTSFQLQAALNLTSKHAKRIYQFCSQWKDLGETKKYAILDFKKALGLADDKGKEEYVLISMFKQKVLDLAVKQINEKTDLHISYQLEKVGRSFKNIVFTVKKQPRATNIPFEVLSSEVATAAGLALHQVENAGRLLAQLSIITPDLVATILGNSAHVAACNKFAHDLKTGKYAKAHSLSGLLLTILGIKKHADGPLFDAKHKTPAK
jgi:plasmid replication initiation protein